MLVILIFGTTKHLDFAHPILFLQRKELFAPGLFVEIHKGPRPECFQGILLEYQLNFVFPVFKFLGLQSLPAVKVSGYGRAQKNITVGALHCLLLGDLF